MGLTAVFVEDPFFRTQAERFGNVLDGQLKFTLVKVSAIAVGEEFEAAGGINFKCLIPFFQGFLGLVIKRVNPPV